MVTGISERNRLRAELVSLGYTLSYINDWTPKTALYRHAPGYNTDGDIVFDVGTVLHGVPGNPDYVRKKANLGQFIWPPSDTCECRWCIAGRGESPTLLAQKDEDLAVSVACQECGFEAKAHTEPGALSVLRIHILTHKGDPA